MPKLSKLEPFNLIFEIYAGNTGAYANSGYYFISNPFNYNISNKCEEVDLSKWSVDSVIDVYLQSPLKNNKIHLRHEFNNKNHKLKIYWVDFEPRYETKLLIKFYSISQQREKTINQILEID